MTIDRLHWVNLSKNGTFRESGQYASTPGDVDAIVAHLVEQQISNLTLYFHGGLVSEKSGMETAERLLGTFRDQGGTHPVFVLWESGWFEKIRDNLDQISAEKLFKKLAEVAFRFVVSKIKPPADGARGLALDLVPPDLVEEELASGHPFAEFEGEEYRQQLEEVYSQELRQMDNVLQGDTALRDEVENVLAALETVDDSLREVRPPESSETASAESLLSGEVLDQMQQDGARGILSAAALIKALGKVFVQVIRRMLNDTDHGIMCTVAEEILRLLYLDHVGQWLWRQMKEDAHSAFDPNEGLAGPALHGGTYVLEQLRRSRHLLPADFRLSLVGHSAGSIYICRLMEKAAALFDPGFAFRNVVFLGPAVDFSLFHLAAVKERSPFERFRMFALQDGVESSDPLVPLLYPRSLLYLVSGLLEGDQEQPIVGMQRFFVEQPAYQDEQTVQAVRRFMEAEPGRVVWSVASGGQPGFNSAADGHGAFDGDAATLESVMHLLRS